VVREEGLNLVCRPSGRSPDAGQAGVTLQPRSDGEQVIVSGSALDFCETTVLSR
jgi:hypothetical protein